MNGEHRPSSQAPAQPPSRRLRAVFVEDLPETELVRPAVVKLLVDHGLSAIVSIRPWNVAATLEAQRTLEAAGVPVTLWPMLADEAGRWVNVRTVEAMRGFVEAIADAAVSGPAAPPLRVLLDLEPPIADVRAVLASRSLVALTRLVGILAAPGGGRDLDALVRSIEIAGGDVSAALVPFVLADGPLGGVSRLLGVPAARGAFDPPWIMAYTTLFAGYSRGYVDRARAVRFLAKAARRAKRTFGPSAALALGCVGRGALGDEAVYPGVDELSEDVETAIREGVNRLALFDLGGVLARPHPERWLRAFTASADEARTESALR